MGEKLTDEKSLVSVIIPCYNGEKFIEEAIESIIHQTYRNWELIIVDDGSTDNSKQVINRYLPDERIQYIFHEENKGIAAARNTGIKVSNGEYIAFLDQDDLWLSDKIKKELSVFNKTQDHKLGLVFSNLYFVSQDGKIINKRRRSNFVGESREETMKRLFLRNPTTLLTALIKRECFHQVGLLNENRFGCDDYEIFLHIASRFKIAYIDEPLAKRRIHSSSASQSEKHREDSFKVTEDLCRIYPFLEKYKDVRLGNLYFSYAVFLIRKGRLTQAREKLLRSVQYNPFLWKSYLLFVLTFGGASMRHLLTQKHPALARVRQFVIGIFKRN